MPTLTRIGDYKDDAPKCNAVDDSNGTTSVSGITAKENNGEIIEQDNTKEDPSTAKIPDNMHEDPGGTITALEEVETNDGKINSTHMMAPKRKTDLNVKTVTEQGGIADAFGNKAQDQQSTDIVCKNISTDQNIEIKKDDTPDMNDNTLEDTISSVNIFNNEPKEDNNIPAKFDDNEPKIRGVQEGIVFHPGHTMKDQDDEIVLPDDVDNIAVAIGSGGTGRLADGYQPNLQNSEMNVTEGMLGDQYDNENNKREENEYAPLSQNWKQEEEEKRDSVAALYTLLDISPRYVKSAAVETITF